MNREEALTLLNASEEGCNFAAAALKLDGQILDLLEEYLKKAPATNLEETQQYIKGFDIIRGACRQLREMASEQVKASRVIQESVRAAIPAIQSGTRCSFDGVCGYQKS